MSADSQEELIQKHNESQKSYFESTLKKTMIPVETPYVLRQVEELIEYGAISPGDRILEVGCGMGRYTLPLLRKGLGVEGLDLSSVLLERLKSYDLDEHEFLLYCSDIIDFPEHHPEEFDKVIGFFTLHHLHHLENCFKAMFQVLKPGGTLIFLEPNPYYPLYYLQIAVTPGMTWEGDKGMVKMRRSIIGKAARSAGFSEFAIKRFGLFPPFLANRRGPARLERFLEMVLSPTPFKAFQLFRMKRPD